MGLYHISEVLDELYKKRARDVLGFISLDGVEDIADSGGMPEIFALLELGAMTSGEVYMANHEFLLHTLWRN